LRPIAATIEPLGEIAQSTDQWLEINTKYAEVWPNITKKKDPPVDHKEHENEENKFEKYLKENL